MDELIFYATQNSQYFANLIQKKLGTGYQGEQINTLFGDGEHYYRLCLNERDDLFGKTVVFVGSTHTDDNLLELYRLGCAAAKLGAKRRIFVIPFLGYSTMERAVLPGEVVTAKTIARQLSTIPNVGLGNIFLMLDLHVSGLVHYFEGDCLCHELYAETVLVEAIKNLKLDNFVMASADLGRSKWVETFANYFNTELAFISKSREGEQTKVIAVIGNVKNKNVVIYDDMTRSAGTIIQAAKAYLDKGANKIYAVLSHLAFNDASVVTKIIESDIVTMIGTNSHPMSQNKQIQNSDKFKVVNVADEFAQRIKKILK